MVTRTQTEKEKKLMKTPRYATGMTVIMDNRIGMVSQPYTRAPLLPCKISSDSFLMVFWASSNSIATVMLDGGAV